LGRARYDRSVAEQVELEPSDGVRRHDGFGRAAEMKRVEGALHDARAALYALPRS